MTGKRKAENGKWLGVVLSALLLAGVAHSQRNRSQVSIHLRPDRATTLVGGTQQFQAEVRGASNRAVKWSIVGNGKEQGSINERGLYSTPAAMSTPAVVTVRAVSAVDSSAVATATVNVPEVSVSVSPTHTRAQAGDTMQFTAKVKNAVNNTVRWMVDGGSGSGMVSSSGLFNLSQAIVTPATLTVRAVSVADPGKMAVAKISVAPISLSIDPSRVEVQVGGSRQFRARFNGTSVEDVIWEVVGGKESGTISDSGLYTTPQSSVTPATVLIKATSAIDPTKFAFAQVTIPAVGIDVSPGPPKDSNRVRGIPITAMSVVKITIPFDPIDNLIRGPLFRGRSGKLYIPAGGAYQLSASVSGTTVKDVTWSLEGTPPLGTISDSGLYVAPSTLTTPKTVVIKATSIADPTRAALTHLTVPPIIVKVEPERTEVCCGAAVQFKAVVDNTENDIVRWSVVGGEENGIINENGLYTPPARITTPATVLVKATSLADLTKEALAVVQIPEVSISIRPDEVELPAGGTRQFTARLNDTKNDAVVWSVEGNAGRVTDAGLFIAPSQVEQPLLIKVKAACAVDPTKFAVATVRVMPRK